jgi:hypothetical protein
LRVSACVFVCLRVSSVSSQPDLTERLRRPVNVRPMKNHSLPDGADDQESLASSRRSFLGLAAVAGFFALNPSAAWAAKKTTKKKRVASPTTTKPVVPKAAAGSTEAAPAAAGATNNEMVVAFAYSPDGGGGRVRNPYVAVWIETPDGQSIRTLALQFQQGRGERWLPDLTRWYQADQARLGGLLGGTDVIGTVSAATKLPGAQRFIWDGNDDAKSPVPAGEYVLYIEAAREKGPYQLVRETISLGKPGVKKPADNGDLKAISVDVRPRK